MDMLETGYIGVLWCEKNKFDISFLEKTEFFKMAAV